MQKPLVSIVLPTYNGSKYIADSIESCINQSYQNWELIVVNDASTDNSEEIINDYKKNNDRIHLLHNEKNKKLPATLNKGFANAKGTYFTWISDDNLFKTNALETFVDALEKNQEIDLFYSDFDIIDDNGNHIEEIRVPKPENLVFMNMIGASFIYKRDLHTKINGFDEEMFLGEDYDFWLRAYKLFSFAPINKNLYRYRYHDNSLSGRHSKKIQKLLANITEKHLKDLTKLPKKTIATAYWELGKTHFRHSNPLKKSIYCTLKAIQIRPIILLAPIKSFVVRKIKIIKKIFKKLLSIYKEQKIYVRIKKEAPVAEKIYDHIVRQIDIEIIKQLAQSIKSKDIHNFIKRFEKIGYITCKPKTKKLTISVVIPHYNQQKYLEQALIALTEQTEQPDEVIVVDDGPEEIDKAEKICNLYTQKVPIRLIKSDKKLYPGLARQLGAELATSDLITTHDADDISHRRRIELTKRFFHEHPDALHLNLGMIRFRGKLFDYVKDFDQIGLKEHTVPTKVILDEMKKVFVEQRFSSFETMPIRWGAYGVSIAYNYHMHCAGHVTYRKELVDKIKWISPYDKSFTSYEDFDINFMILMATQKSFLLNLPLIWYRKGTSSFIFSKKLGKLKRDTSSEKN
jgi:glycosyltransferase involved in cell wall biosynthesis